jgi:SAM-dependent methyltransferase
MVAEMFMTKTRSNQQIEEHYNIEKELASKLRDSSKQERQNLYGYLYDQLFQLVPHHPQLERKQDPHASAKEVGRKMRLLSRFLQKSSILLEVGPGDCCLAFEASKYVKKIYAVDVSQEIVNNLNPPENFELILSDGCTIPLPTNTVDIAYSNQLMEHLHPDDAFEQICNIYKALNFGGIYICITPNRLSGPHDISKYFDEVATGFHLKEYTCTDLSSTFSHVGFSKIKTYIGGKGIYLRFPLFLLKWLEARLDKMPFFWRKRIARTFLFRALLGVIIVVQK